MLRELPDGSVWFLASDCTDFHGLVGRQICGWGKVRFETRFLLVPHGRSC